MHQVLVHSNWVEKSAKELKEAHIQKQNKTRQKIKTDIHVHFHSLKFNVIFQQPTGCYLALIIANGGGNAIKNDHRTFKKKKVSI